MTGLLIATGLVLLATVAVVIGARRTPRRGMPTEGGTW